MRTILVLSLLLAPALLRAQDLDVDPPQIRLEANGLRYDGPTIRLPSAGFRYEGIEVEVGTGGVEVEGWEARLADLLDVKTPEVDLNGFGFTHDGLEVSLLEGRFAHGGGRFRIRKSGITLREIWLELGDVLVDGPELAIRSSGIRFEPPRIRSRAAEEEAAIASLRSIAAAQESFRAGDLDGDGAADYAQHLSELASGGAVDGDLATGEAGAYLYHLQAEGADSWSATAEPRTGHGRSFYLDATGVVRSEWNAPVGPESPPRG